MLCEGLAIESAGTYELYVEEIELLLKLGSRARAAIHENSGRERKRAQLTIHRQVSPRPKLLGFYPLSESFE